MTSNGDRGGGRRLEMWQFVVYFDATDYPGVYVVRPVLIARCYVCDVPLAQPMYGPLVMHKTLEDARRSIWLPGLYRFPRFELDARPVVESWL